MRHSLIALAALARAGAQIVEGVLPAGLFCESWIGGIEGEGRDVADGLGAGALERGAGARQGGSDNAPEVVRGNAHAGTRVLERLLQLLLVLQDALVTGSFVVIHLRPRAGEPLGVGLLLDRLGERFGLPAVDARRLHPVLDTLLDDLAGGAELLLDHLGLAHQRVEHDVGLALLVFEIAAEHLFRGLKLAINAAVALLQPRRIPGQIEVDQVGAPSLQVDALARGVGADQDTKGFLGGVSIEGSLHLLAAILAGGAGEDADALVDAVGIGERLVETLFQPAPRVLPFGEDDEAAIIPRQCRTAGCFLSTGPASARGHPA